MYKFHIAKKFLKCKFYINKIHDVQVLPSHLCSHDILNQKINNITFKTSSS